MRSSYEVKQSKILLLLNFCRFRCIWFLKWLYKWISYIWSTSKRGLPIIKFPLLFSLFYILSVILFSNKELSQSWLYDSFPVFVWMLHSFFTLFFGKFREIVCISLYQQAHAHHGAWGITEWHETIYQSIYQSKTFTSVSFYHLAITHLSLNVILFQAGLAVE